MLSLGLSLLLSCHPISQLANHLYPVVWETPGQATIRVAWLYLCHPHQAEPESQSPLSRVCVLATPIVPSPLWVLLLTHIPSPCQGCISTTPTCAFPVASLLFPLSVPKEECLVFIAAYITVLPSQRLGHSLPVLRVSLGATVDGDLACVPDSLYSTRERCRGPHLSISMLERRCCHWQVSHCPTVLVTFPLCAKAPRPRHLVGGKVIGGL